MYFLSCKADPNSTPEVKECHIRQSQTVTNVIIVSAVSHESAGEYVEKHLLGNFRTGAEPEVSEKRPLRALLTKASNGGRRGIGRV